MCCVLSVKAVTITTFPQSYLTLETLTVRQNSVHKFAVLVTYNDSNRKMNLAKFLSFSDE